MPKRPRQAHIPRQQPTRRKPRRAFGGAAAPEADFEPEYYPDEGTLTDTVASGVANVTNAPAPRAGRRMEVLQRSREIAAPTRSSAGALPTFERSYLMAELKLTGVITASLLGLIIVLTVLLR